MILLWGLPGDRPLTAVATSLREADAPTYLLDQRIATRMEVDLEPGPPVSGRVLVDGVEVLALGDVTAAYIRPYDSARVLRRLGTSDPRALAHANELDRLLLGWADLAPVRVVNRPEAMSSNDSKPYQAALIAHAGFRTPETLITTDIRAVARFRARHGELVYKSISSTRSIVSRLRDDHEGRLPQIRWCPTQFQRYIDGCDYRIHVVGNELFAAEIRTDADDYRYRADPNTELVITATEVPAAVESRCRKVTAALGLSFAGIDLRLAGDGDWYCFEVNPFPGFTFYQDQPECRSTGRWRAS